MSYIEDIKTIKGKIQMIRQGKYSEGDIKRVCEIVFMRQLEWDEYPSQDKIEDVIDAVEEQRQEIRKDFNVDLIRKLNAKIESGDVDAMVLLGQYYYNCPKDQQIEDLLVKEYFDKEFMGGAGCEDEVSRKRIDTTQQKASELFYSAYQASYQARSILSMYYLAKLWCSRSHNYVKPQDILEDFNCQWNQGEMTPSNRTLDGRSIEETVRYSLTVCALAETYIQKEVEKTEQVESDKKYLEEWLRQLSHILTHYLHPEMLKDTANNFFLDEKKHRKEAFLNLFIESMNESKFIDVCHMHRLRYSDKHDIASTIRRQRNTIDHVEIMNVHELVNQVLLQFFHEIFFIQREKFSNLREICSHRIGLSLDNMKQKFTDMVFCSATSESDASVLNWIEELGIISLDLNDGLWKQVKLPSGGIAASIISSHLFELLNNTRRACFPSTSGSLITLKFRSDERQFIDKKNIFLNIEVFNSTNDELSKSINLLGSGKGLNLIKHDLMALNNDPENDVSFEHKSDNGEFQVMLRYRQDLFIKPQFIL